MVANAGQINDGARELRELVRGADSIELEPTTPEHSYRSAAAALGAEPIDAQIRQVFVFDTADLDVGRAGVDFLASNGISTDGEQQTKTKTALECLSAALHPLATPASRPTGPRRRTLAAAVATDGAAGGAR